jgi:hypothetical protein
MWRGYVFPKRIKKMMREDMMTVRKEERSASRTRKMERLMILGSFNSRMS